MLWNDDRGILRYDPSGLLCTFLNDKAAESSEVNIISFCKRALDRSHEGLNGMVDLKFLDSGLFVNLVDDVSFCH